MFAWYSQILVKQRQEVLTAMLSGPEWQFLVCRLLNVATGDIYTILASLKICFLLQATYSGLRKISPLQ